jgi:general secretion pathway protein G
VQAPGGAQNWNPDGYLDRVPVDPWGNEYVYFSDGQNFVVKSYGGDGAEGGDAKNSDISSEDY